MAAILDCKVVVSHPNRKTGLLGTNEGETKFFSWRCSKQPDKIMIFCCLKEDNYGGKLSLYWNQSAAPTEPSSGSAAKGRTVDGTCWVSLKSILLNSTWCIDNWDHTGIILGWINLIWNLFDCIILTFFSKVHWENICCKQAATLSSDTRWQHRTDKDLKPWGASVCLQKAAGSSHWICCRPEVLLVALNNGSSLKVCHFND